MTQRQPSTSRGEHAATLNPYAPVVEREEEGTETTETSRPVKASAVPVLIGYALFVLLFVFITTVLSGAS